MSDHSQLNLINEAHEFPGPFVLKVIGKESVDFQNDVITTTRAILAMPGQPNFALKRTPNGKYLSITLDIEIQDIAQLQLLYQSLKDIDDVVMTI